MVYALVLSGALALDTGDPPIEVQRCTTGTEMSGMLIKTDGNYQISFVNRDPRTVDNVRFIVHLGAHRIFIRDVGTFASGVAVAHRFPNRGGEIVLVDEPQISCEVKWVHFTDGTQWAEPGS